MYGINQDGIIYSSETDNGGKFGNISKHISNEVSQYLNL